jgi:diguanylate cyclase (GGDEF)-like protein
MALNWKDFSGSDYFKGLPEPDQGAARQRFFDDQVAPRFAPEQRESALAEFNRRTMTPATVAAPAQAPASIQRPQANVAARAAVAPPVAEQAAMPQRPVRPGQVQPAAAEPAIAAPAGGAGFVEGMKDFGRTAVKSVVQGIPEAAANLADYIDTPEFDASGRQISDDGALSKWARATRAAAEKRGEPWQESTFGQEARAKDDMSWRGGAGAAGESMGLSWGPGLAGAAAGAAIGSMAGGVGAIPGAAAGYAIGSLATLPLFFGAQAKDTYDRVFKQAKIDNPELDDESAHDKAVVAGGFTGLIEAAGERVSDIVGGKLFRLMPPGVKNGMVRAATKSFQGVRPMIADMLKIVGTEVGIELAQGASQSAVEASYGVGEGPTWQNQKGVIVPTIIMSLVGGGAAQGVSAAARYRTAKLLQDPARDPEQRLIAARNVAGAIHQQDPELANLFLGEAQNLIAARKPVIAEGDQFYRDLKPLAQREEDQRMAAGEDMPSEEARTAAFGEAPADVPRGTEIPPEAFAQPEGPEAADTLATDENGDIIIEDGGDAPGAEIPADRFARPEDAPVEVPPAEPGVPGVSPPTEQPITDAAAVAPPQESQESQESRPPEAPIVPPNQAGVPPNSAPDAAQRGSETPLTPEARKQHMTAIGANLKVLRAERDAAKKAGDEALMAEVDDEIQATAVNFKRLANNQPPLPTPREQAQIPQVESEKPHVVSPNQDVVGAALPKNDGIDLADEQPVKALDDERMQDPDFRNWMEQAVGGLVSVKDGNLGLAVDPNFIKGESDRGDEVRMVRAGSVNPPWFQEIAAAENVSVDGLRGIVKKAMTGAKLGVRQDRAVRKLMDAITDERIGELEDWGRGLGMSAEEVSALHNDDPVAHMRALESEVSARQKKAADAEVEQQWAEQDAVVAGKKAFTPDVVLGEDAPDVDGYDFSDQEAIEGHVYATAVGWGVPVAQLDELHAQAPDAESFLSSVRNAIREIRANEKIRSDQGEAGSVADIGGPGAPESGESAAAEAERLAALEQARAEAIPALEEYLGTDWRKDGERRARLAAASPDELVEEVYRDKMTGLLNKRAWNEDTTKAGFEKQGRRSKPYAIAYIDLDGLKFLNDQMGHSAGDELLANFGRAMTAAGIDGYHISGDEFGAIFDTEAEAREAMSRLEQAVASSVVRGKSRDGRGITNAGIAFSYGVGPTADAADMAMQANKADREAQGLRGGARGGMPATASYDVLEQYDQADIDAKAAADKKRETDEAKAAARQKADDERGGFTLSGSNRPADKAIAAGQDELFGATPQKAKPAAQTNTIFTEDAAEKARAILRAKLGQVNTGIDPEIVQAGITLAGYHIEKGARTFSAYTKAMLADLGEIVRPYLKSWYVAVKLDPRATGFEGMDSLAAVEAADVDAIGAKAPAAPADPINAAAHQAATSPENALPQPTDAQKEAGNYQKGHVTWNGLDVTIENPAGSKRRPEWPTLAAHYGYLKRTEGADGEHVDVFVNPDEASRTDGVVVIDQLQGGKKGAGFDEHKVMLGFKDKAAAIAAYKANFTKGWHVGPAVEMTVDEFNAWLAKGDQTAPIAAASTPESQKSKGHIAWIDPTPANPARRELVARDDGKIGIADADNAIDMATGNRFSRSQALDTPENRARLLQGLAPEAKDAPPAADEDLSSAADPLAPTGDEAFDKALQNRTIRFAMTRAKMTEKRGEYNGVPYVTRTWTASVKLRGRSERDALPGYLKVNRTLPEPVGEDTSFILSTRTGSNVGDAMNAEIQISRTEFDYQDGKSEAPAAAPTASEPKPADLLGEEQKPKTRIADFGERIEGAAKYRDRYSDQMTEAMEADIAAVPLSESWPEPDYEKMLEEGADPGIVAFVHAARDEIPVKPKKRWKVAGWTEAVRLLRDVSNGLINGSIPADKFRETLAKPEFMRVARDVGGRADLYQAVGHGVSLKGVTLRARSFSRLQPDNSWKEIRDWGVEREAKASAFGNWPQELGVGNTREEAIAAFKAKHAEMAGAEKPDAQTSFEIYRYRANPGVVVIGKKIGKDRVDLAQFPTLAEARDYLKNSHDDLVAKLEAYKKIPRERRLTNEPRVGVNHRNGSNVTAEQFQETFGFRGGQFGSSLLSSQKEAQTHLNEAYDALMDMAGVLGVPPRALSLNGELALAFGARGKGGKDAASAHYEPDTKGAVTDSTVVINLTRKHGAGSLAHEWFHALDNYFARARKERGGMLTERPFPRGDGVRPEMVAAFKNLMDTIKRTTLEQRSMALDKRRTKLYWSTGLEMAARSFESYIIEKLRDQGASNDYLANIVSPEYWAAEEALRDFAETGNMGEQQEQTYPYPTAAEIPAIRAAFDHFFQTIETKETDKGIAIQEGEGVYSVESRGKKYGDRASQPIDDLFGLFGDPYENAEQRPGTTEKQRDLGRDALRDLSRRIGLDSVARRFNAGGSAPSILGAGLVRNFVAGQPNSLIGGTIQSPRDLAALAQVYRDPRFETFRIAYLKGDTVVGEAGYSSRMPGIVNMGNDFITDVSNDMARFGADGYYAMHNHPSGKSAPSTADANLTILLDRKVPGFLGHVVIDHNEYSVLDASGWHKTIQDDKLGSADFRADPVVQSDLLGAEVKGPRDVVDLAKRVQKPDMATVVMTVAGETGRVNLVVDLPADALRSHAPRMGALIRRMARGSGSGGNRFLVLPDGYPKAAFQHLITYGVFTDVVGADGTSSVEELPSLYDVFRRRDVLTKGLKGARVYEPEALYSRGAEEEEDAISKAKQAAIAARNAFRAIDRTKKIEDADSYFDLSSKMSDAKSAFADALGQIPADQFALRGMTSDGRILLLTPSAQRPGFWQLTRFDINGEPWGDTQYPTREQATREFLDDATPESVTDHSAQFSRGDSAKGHTEAALYDRLRGLFGPKFMDRLFQTGRFRVITGQDAASILGMVDTDALRSGGAVRGFYHRGNGITYLVADSIPAKFTDAQLKGLMRHEIGVHALKAGRDSAGWQKILGEIDRLINAGDKAAHAAFLRAGAAGTRDVDLLEEVAGYLVEDAPDSSIVRRILAWLKDQVFKLTGMQLKLTDADIVAMARAALRRAPDLLAGIGTAPRLTPVYSAPAPIWVSALRQRIAEQGAKTRTGNDWSAWLQGNAAKLGIKRDEIEWSGITDYLTARGKDKLTTAEITDWLSANGVQVQEVNLGQSAGAQESVGEIRARLTQALEAEGYGIEFDDFGGDYDVTYLDEDGEAIQYDELSLRAQEIVDRESQAELLAQMTNDTKYGQYQLPGGENYRELLLTLPVKDKAISLEEFAQAYRANNPRASEGTVRREYDRQVAEVEKTQYRSGHFEQPNILAHVRFNERTDADGKRVLFVEEVQSDWAQEGRKAGFGYKDATPLTPEDDRELMSLFDMRENRTAAQTARMHELNNRLNASQGKKGTPPAPFVTDTKAWTKLALSRMIRYAVDNGFDAVAWTTGEQQAARYDLSKQINRVEVSRPQDGSFAIYAYKNKADTVPVIQKRVATAPEVADLLGKEFAEKAEKQPIGTKRDYSGLDLKVGGEGMRAFYDGIVPQVARDLLKKIGGGGVESITLDTGAGAPTGTAGVRGIPGVTPMQAFSQRGVEGAQPGFAITDQMREIAGRGMAMFSRAQNPVQGALVPPAQPPQGETSEAYQAIRDRVLAEPDALQPLPKRITGWLKDHWEILQDEWRQGMVDSFDRIAKLETLRHGKLLDASESAYKAATHTRNLSSVIGVIMERGAIKLENGSIALDGDSKGFLSIFEPLKARGLMQDWELWAAAKRAKLLMEEDAAANTVGARDLAVWTPILNQLNRTEPANYTGGARKWHADVREAKENIDSAKKMIAQKRERLMTPDMVDSVLSEIAGNASLRDLFNEVHRDWRQFNKAMLDFAESSGLIDAGERRLWERDEYVPFHRVSLGEGEQKGGKRKRSLSGQKSGIVRLKGGVEKLGIVEAMVRNMAHLVDASLKNLAMQRVVDLTKDFDVDGSPVLEKIASSNLTLDEIRAKLDELDIDHAGRDDKWLMAWRGPLARAEAGHGTVTVMRGGKQERYMVHDRMLLDSITNMGAPAVEGVMKLFSFSKRLLTDMVTAEPAFAIANFLRDSISTAVTVHGKDSGFSITPIVDGIRGANEALKKNDKYWTVMASGAVGGNFYDTSPDDVRRHLSNLYTSAGVLNSLHRGWQWYQDKLQASELGNRLAVFDAYKSAGASDAEAAYQAGDVLQFSRRGSWKAMQILTTAVPFLNARIQGLDRLGRGAQANPKAFALKGAILMAATLAILASNWDDDDYWDLKEHDRDTYYHLMAASWTDKNGKRQWIRIPKPFEVGAFFSTIPERIFEQMRSDADTKLLGQRMLQMIADTFAMNPVPQLVKPLAEMASNMNWFTGAPIVSEGMEYVRPEQQYTPYTSDTMKAMAEAMPDSAPEWMRSPVRLESVMRGYLGSLGGYALMASDYVVREMLDEPNRPEMRPQDYPVVKRFVRGEGATKHVDRAYEIAREADQLFMGISKLQKEGRREDALRMHRENIDKLRVRAAVNRQIAEMSRVSAQIRRVYDSKGMTDEQKRKTVDMLAERRNYVAENVSKRYWATFR